MKAATAWVDKAIPAAADKGDHNPMRDLLVATNVIEPPKDGPKVIVQIGVQDCDVHMMLSPADAGGSGVG